jgi:tetratricopeptide (TPR) repeat protein
VSGDEMTATAGLSVEARAMVHAAAILGPEFDLDMLEAVAGLAPEALRSALAEAERAGLLQADGSRGGFAQAHVRAAVVEEIPPLDQAQLHGRALDYSIQAGRRADESHAWEEAAEHYRTALRVRELRGERGDRLHCDLLLALGFSQSYAGSDEAPDSFAAAGETARMLGDPEMIARAALGMGASRGANDEDAEWLEAALVGLGSDETPLRARVLAQLSLELPSTAQAGRRIELSTEAVDLARRTGHAKTLADCLDARHEALWRPEWDRERLAAAGEIAAIGEQLSDRDILFGGVGWTVADLMELGDVAAVDLQVDAAAAHGPHWRMSIVRGMRAQLTGDLPAAERLAAEALALSPPRTAEAADAHAFQCFQVRREQGRLAEVEPMVRERAEEPLWAAALTLLLLETGRADEARAAYAEVCGRLDRMPDDPARLMAVALLAEVCSALGDVEGAGRLYPLLEDHHRRALVVGRGTAFLGCASRLLGLLAATARDWDLAGSNFEEALLMHEAMGARAWVARTQIDCAGMLAALGDGDGARELLAEALAAAEALGLDAVARHAGAKGGETVRPRA